MMHASRWKKLMIAAGLAVLPACGMGEANSPESPGLDPKSPTVPGQTRDGLNLGTQTTWLPARGDYGGVAGGIACPANSVAVGIQGTLNAYLNSIGLLCRTLNANGTLGASSSTPVAGNQWGTGFSLQCPDGMAIVGFPGHTGWYVDSLGLYCAAPNAWMSSATVQSTVAEAGSPYSNPFSDVCPQQQVVTQLAVRNGDVLDQEQALCTRMVAGPPASCQDIKNANPSATDGEYTLNLNGDASKPWKAWCRNMAGTPAEYLTLKYTGGNSNFSQYTVGGYTVGSDVRTTFTRLRINPATLAVDITDQAFATSTGSLTLYDNPPQTSVSYALAVSCGWPQGLGNIDLRDTPFTVDTAQLAYAGWAAGGYASPGGIGQFQDLRGWGSCGSFGAQNGTTLQLQYTPLPRSCQDIKTAAPGAGDGEYRLYINGDVSRPWTAYCHNMASAPAEYLTLKHTGGNSNFSQYTVGGYTVGSDVRTTFTRLRINPATLAVDITDQAFATSTGSLTLYDNPPQTSVSYALAVSCGWPQGLGNIDLRDTPFTVDTAQLAYAGWAAGGYASPGGIGQFQDLRGWGSCGSFGPADGATLALTYQAP